MVFFHVYRLVCPWTRFADTPYTVHMLRHTFEAHKADKQMGIATL
jgi:hypothetical protein